jgi:hypothetical protein
VGVLVSSQHRIFQRDVCSPKAIIRPHDAPSHWEYVNDRGEIENLLQHDPPSYLTAPSPVFED